jgi:dephospho-CoA kinase
MLRIGVTGGMASGKSTVARRFEEHGAIRIDGDELGQKTVRMAEIRNTIAAEFGPEVIGADGAVDRARLGALVFRDPRAMERLNRIVQPALLVRVRRELETARAGPAGVVVLDAALISTWGIEPELDGLVEVTAPETLRIQRLARARGFTEEVAMVRARGQSLPPLRGTCRLWKIENSGDVGALEAQVDRIWGEILRLRRRPGAGHAS